MDFYRYLGFWEDYRMISLGVIFCRVGGSGGILAVGGFPGGRFRG